MQFTATSLEFEVQALTSEQLQNIIGGSTPLTAPSGSMPIATTGYSILLADGTIVPNTGWVPTLTLL